MFHRKFRSMKQQTLREDAYSREAETCRKRPRETPECVKAHSFSQNFSFLRIVGCQKSGGTQVGKKFIEAFNDIFSTCCICDGSSGGDDGGGTGRTRSAGSSCSADSSCSAGRPSRTRSAGSTRRAGRTCCASRTRSAGRTCSASWTGSAVSAGRPSRTNSTVSAGRTSRAVYLCTTLDFPLC